MLSRPNDCLHAEDIFRRCYENSSGYFHYTERFNGKSMDVRCHRYIYEQCFGEIPKGRVVMHTCDNRWCVQPAHLKVGTVRDNHRDAMKKGRHTRGSRHGMSRLTEADIPKIRERLKGDDTLKEIGKDFGVTYHPIWCIKHGKTWKDV